MHELPLNIVEFIRHPDLLNDRTHSEAQLVCLKSIYGLPLSPSELEIYRKGTGRQEYDATEQRKVTITAGRQSGKTGKIAAPVVCFEAFRDHGLPPGEVGYILLLAPTIAQARFAYHYILKYLRRSPVLSKRIVKTTKYKSMLDNGVVITCCACTYDGVRGRTIIMVVCDEFAFWPDGTNAANPRRRGDRCISTGDGHGRQSEAHKNNDAVWQVWTRMGRIPGAVGALFSGLAVDDG